VNGQSNSKSKSKSRIFIPDASLKPTRWLVQGLFALGDTVIVAAQPAVGKSFFVEALATSVAYDKPFLNYDVAGGNVLIVDEDTPTSTLTNRLTKFAKFYKNDRPYNVYLHSKEGYQMDNGSLAKLVSGYEDLRLVVIDCLVSISGKADLDRTIDMKCLTSFLQDISREDMVIIINHHISTKKTITPEEAMTCGNPQALLMNNTRIASASDALYILASPDVDGVLKTLLVRPISRRITLPVKMFSARFIEENTSMHFHYGEPLDIKKSLSRDEQRVLSLFESGEQLTVKAALQRATQWYSDKTLREMLHSLEDKGYLQFVKREGKGGRLFYERIL